VGGGAAAFATIIDEGTAAMGLFGGVLGFFVGLPIGLAAAYFLYLRYFAARRRLQVRRRRASSSSAPRCRIYFEDLNPSRRENRRLIVRVGWLINSMHVFVLNHLLGARTHRG
jgi:hypothetical protein